MRRALRGLVLSSAAAALLGCGSSAPRPGPSAPPALRLVVLVVIDQLPTWAFERDRPVLRGGIGRLIERGTYFARGTYPYANTYTATGHAALATGAPPRLTGIVGNSWFEGGAAPPVDSTADPAQPTLAALPGAKPADGHSSHRLRVPGISDALAARPGARAVTLALKPRAAILAAGQRGALSIWYDDTQPAMTTSTAFAAELPGWLREFNRAHPVADRLREVWRPGDPALLARLSGNVDDGPGEGLSEGGLGHTFPHDVARAPNPADALHATPMATDMLLDAAEAAIAGERLGADDVTDYLSISISSHDYAGHAWGQESWERLDLMLRLDRRLDELLGYLDRTVGAGRYAVVLTGDHGVIPLVEQSVKAGHRARRIPRAEILAAVERGAASVLGPGTWTAGFIANTVVMSPAFRARSEGDRARALAAAVAALERVPDIGLVGTAASLSGDCAARAGLAERLACESIAPGRSGEIYAATADRSLPVADNPTGTSHGTPSLLDREVPIIVAVPGRPARRVDQPVSMLRVAPTLARLLGVAPPSAASERPLVE